MKRALQSGFTLIELAIIVALLGILLAIAMPQLGDWIANQRIRTAAEGVVNGLQLARSEAVRSNTLVDLQIAADGISWNVVNGGAIVQTRSGESGVTSGGTITTTAGATAIAFPLTITYNGLGRITGNISSIGMRYNSTGSGLRAMCAAVIANTPRLCDPQLTDSTDPRACFMNGAAVAGC